MGVQPRVYALPANNEAAKSPSMQTATSPVTRKRRYMDVVLVDTDARDDDRELTQRVSFKRSKSNETELRVHVHERETTRDSESLEPLTPTSTTSESAADKTSPSTKTSARPNMSASQTITLDMLRPHFEKPLAQVAQIFGICVTLLKKICRKNGLARWPHRQIIGLRKSIASMEQAISHFEGARRESYAQQLDKQRKKLAALLEDPTKCNLLAVDEDYAPVQPVPAPVTPVHTAVPTQVPAPHPYYPAYASAMVPPPAPVYERAPPAYADYYYAPPPPPVYVPQQPYYPTAYASPYHNHVPSAPSVVLPPLRTDVRPLPSLSALVGRRW